MVCRIETGPSILTNGDIFRAGSTLGLVISKTRRSRAGASGNSASRVVLSSRVPEVRSQEVDKNLRSKNSVKRDLLQCQKRPTTVSKETYYSVKRLDGSQKSSILWLYISVYISVH